jgi:hypothetical protein
MDEPPFRIAQTKYIDSHNRIDVNLVRMQGQIIEFAVNYSTLLEDWHPVYRIDNHHGFVHEQRLWIDKKPRPVSIELPNGDARELIRAIVAHITIEHTRYRQWMMESLQRNSN